jgi:hypothetical protein
VGSNVKVPSAQIPGIHEGMFAEVREHFDRLTTREDPHEADPPPAWTATREAGGS